MGSFPKSVICILGMHRSGTSSLTGCLEDHGLFLGDVVNHAPYNKKGNKENVPLRLINDDVLAYSGGSWDRPPSELNWSDDLRRRRDEHIACYSHVGRWGFKDPRTILTLPFWMEALPDMGLVGTFRKPDMVVASIMKRPGMAPTVPALTLWKIYNKKLLTYASLYKHPLVCFDWPQNDYRSAVDIVAKNLGLGANHREPCDFYDETLRQRDETAQDGAGSDEEAERIYMQLLKLAIPTKSLQADKEL